MHTRGILPLLIVGITSVWGAGAAQAYMCSQASDNADAPSLSWFTRTIPYALSRAGTTHISGDTEREVLRASFEVWEELTATSGSCDPSNYATDIHFREGPLSDTAAAGYDPLHPEENENLLIFLEDHWTDDPNTIALTTTTFSSTTGQIIDADIELNAYLFNFSTDETASGDHDLMNTAVHEIGHLLGLDHTAVRNATMFLTAEAGEISKRTLHCDDVQAIAFKYPVGQPNGYCDLDGPCPTKCVAPPERIADVSIAVTDIDNGLSSGCACRDNDGGSHIWATLALILWLLRRRLAPV